MTRVAVFARNHGQYLDHACELAIQDPTRMVTFRSKKPWARMKKALANQETATVYLAPNGSDGLVSYVATLHSLVLYPKRGDVATDQALAFQLPETVNDALWESDDGPIQTLYIIAKCRKIAEPFSLANLVKESNNEPVSEKYGYSYVPVWELAGGSSHFESPEEVAEPELFVEGTSRQVSVNAFERNPLARAACIDHYGYLCTACGLDFGLVYGDIGKEFIHVHHVKPLAAVGKQYVVNPVEDLRPVCPNCHAMIHKRDPPFSVEEIAELIMSKNA